MTMRTAGKICIAHLSCAALLWLSTHGLAEEPGDAELGIRQVVPSGEDVPAGNQIVIEFDQPVVPLGRMERRADELPITIKPELKCKWRWLNPRALACNLDEQDRMREAMRYSVTIDPGIETTAGTTTATRTSIEIVTVRPMISYVSFRTWRHPGVPVLRVVFNQPVTKSSTQRSLRLLGSWSCAVFPRSPQGRTLATGNFRASLASQGNGRFSNSVSRARKRATISSRERRMGKKRGASG